MKKHRLAAKKQNLKINKPNKNEKILSLLEPRSLLHSFSPLLLQDPSKWLEPFHENSGVSVSEDAKNVYIEASLPGILPEEINIKYEHGVVCITANKKEETSDKNKKFYRKAHKSFFYQIALPCPINEEKTPNAVCKDGVLKITFLKSFISYAKNKTISVKKG